MLINWDSSDLPPYFHTNVSLVQSVLRAGNGHEKRVFRGTNHRVLEGGGSRGSGEGVVPQVSAIGAVNTAASKHQKRSGCGRWSGTFSRAALEGVASVPEDRYHERPVLAESSQLIGEMKCCVELDTFAQYFMQKRARNTICTYPIKYLNKNNIIDRAA